MKSPELEATAIRYADSRGIKVYLGRPLGDGTDGSVYPTNRNSAVKALKLEKTYVCERDCYLRLSERAVDRIDGLAVPKIIDFDDSMLVVEIEIVQPPYLLDFGKAYLDHPSPFTKEQLAGYEASLASYFRIDDIPRVKKVCRILRGYGIEYLDAKPQNIRLRNEADEEKLPDDDWEKEPPTDYSGYELDE